MTPTELQAALLTYTPDEVWATSGAIPYTYRLLQRTLNYRGPYTTDFVYDVGCQREPVAANWQKATIALREFKDIHRGALREACDYLGCKPPSVGLLRSDFRARCSDWGARATSRRHEFFHNDHAYMRVSSLYYNLAKVADKAALSTEDLGAILGALHSLNVQKAADRFLPIANAWLTEVTV